MIAPKCNKKVVVGKEKIRQAKYQPFKSPVWFSFLPSPIELISFSCAKPTQQSKGGSFPQTNNKWGWNIG